MNIGSEAEMQAWGVSLAKHLAMGDVLCLYGDLGVGKSVLARAIIRCIAGDPTLEVPSPSFTLVQSYDFNGLHVLHLDAYRLSGAQDLFELGFPENFASHISLIEWPERLGELTPARRLDIQILDMGGDDRQLDMTYHGEWNWQK